MLKRDPESLANVKPIFLERDRWRRAAPRRSTVQEEVVSSYNEEYSKLSTKPTACQAWKLNCNSPDHPFQSTFCFSRYPPTQFWVGQRRQEHPRWSPLHKTHHAKAPRFYFKPVKRAKRFRSWQTSSCLAVFSSPSPKHDIKETIPPARNDVNDKPRGSASGRFMPRFSTSRIWLLG